MSGAQSTASIGIIPTMANVETVYGVWSGRFQNAVDVGDVHQGAVAVELVYASTGLEDSPEHPVATTARIRSLVSVSNLRVSPNDRFLPTLFTNRLTGPNPHIGGVKYGCDGACRFPVRRWMRSTVTACLTLSSHAFSPPGRLAAMIGTRDIEPLVDLGDVQVHRHMIRDQCYRWFLLIEIPRNGVERLSDRSVVSGLIRAKPDSFFPTADSELSRVISGSYYWYMPIGIHQFGYLRLD